MAPELVLRDIHQPPPPPWWPPAPGWWIVAGVVLALCVALAWWRSRVRRRRRVLERLFDHAVDIETGGAAQVAAMSELLRRASRRRDPAADRLQGEAWLAFLDDSDATRPFSSGPGRLLLDGPWRPAVDVAEVDALRTVARARFLAWMRRR